VETALGSPAVLVVDDDPDTREVVALALGLAGYAVEIAQNGREALARIAARVPALVLLDLDMPDLSGWEVVDLLRVMQVPVPVVFMTAAHRARAEAARLQVAGYLSKPFDLDHLLDLVNQFTQAPSGQSSV
jgi:CheY-like chemotaxis protein